MGELFPYHEQLDGQKIRLIRLEPEGDGEEIQCSLTCESIDSASPYNALSYTWGDATQTRQIICNGATCTVTLSLYEALAHIRKRYQGSPLWADAICINQNDEIEKTQQVRIMESGDRAGYELAHRLRTMVGNANENSSEAFERSRQIEDFEWDSQLQPLMDMTEGWLGLGKLLCRRWFSRAWVIQELLMAQSTHMLSGDFEMDAEVLLNSGSLLLRTYRLLSHLNVQAKGTLPGLSAKLACVNALGALKGGLWEGEMRNPLLLFALTRSFKATDPRDRIFALVGLLPYVPQSFINYRRDRAAISSDVAKFMMRFTPLTEALSWASVLGSIDGGSSWATDWTNTDDATGNPIMILLSNEVVEGIGSPSFRFEDDGVLAIHARELDTIGSIGRSLNMGVLDGSVNVSDDTLAFDLVSQFYPWIQDMLHIWPHETYVTGIPTREAVWRALILDGSLFHYPAPLEYGDRFEAWIEGLREGPESSKAIRSYRRQGGEIPEELLQRNQTVQQNMRKAGPFETVLGRVALNRNFAVTAKGYLGWVPQVAQVGDTVASFDGSYVPFILRRASANQAIRSDVKDRSDSVNVTEDRWRMIGDSYFLGYMGDAPMKMDDIPSGDIFIV